MSSKYKVEAAVAVRLNVTLKLGITALRKFKSVLES